MFPSAPGGQTRGSAGRVQKKDQYYIELYYISPGSQVLDPALVHAKAPLAPGPHICKEGNTRGEVRVLASWWWHKHSAVVVCAGGSGLFQRPGQVIQLADAGWLECCSDEVLATLPEDFEKGLVQVRSKEEAAICGGATPNCKRRIGGTGQTSFPVECISKPLKLLGKPGLDLFRLPAIRSTDPHTTAVVRRVFLTRLLYLSFPQFPLIWVRFYSPRN